MRNHRGAFILPAAILAATTMFALIHSTVRAQDCTDARGNPVACPGREKEKKPRPTQPPATSTATVVPAPTLVQSGTILDTNPSGAADPAPSTTSNQGSGPGSREFTDQPVFPWSEGSFWGNVFAPGLLLAVIIGIVISLFGRRRQKGPHLNQGNALDGWPLALGSTTHEMLHDGDKTHHFTGAGGGADQAARDLLSSSADTGGSVGPDPNNPADGSPGPGADPNPHRP